MKIRDSLASDLVNIIKQMNRGYHLEEQYSGSASGMPGYTHYVSLTFKTNQEFKRDNVKKQLAHNILKLGFKNGSTDDSFSKNINNKKLTVTIQIDNQNQLYVRIYESDILKKDSKLYKIDNKIVKANSVTDAISKIKLRDSLESDIISRIQNLRFGYKIVKRETIKAYSTKDTFLKFKTADTTTDNDIIKSSIKEILRKMNYAEAPCDNYHYDFKFINKVGNRIYCRVEYRTNNLEITLTENDEHHLTLKKDDLNSSIVSKDLKSARTKIQSIVSGQVTERKKINKIINSANDDIIRAYQYRLGNLHPKATFERNVCHKSFIKKIYDPLMKVIEKTPDKDVKKNLRSIIVDLDYLISTYNK